MERELTEERNFTVTVTQPGGCKRVLAIEVPEAELVRERERVLRELRRELRVPGFRQGKVPESYVLKHYASVINSDAVRNLLPVVYEQAVMKESLHPLGDPTFDNLKQTPGEGLKMEAHIEVRPEVTVGGYDALRVEARRQEVTDERVTHMIEHMREHMAAYESVQRAATSSDFAVIDYVPYLDNGERDESSRQANYPVELSSEALLEPFRVGLVGMSPGDEKDIAVTYPADFSEEELAGKERRFHVRLVEVKEKLLPELNDNFARRVDEKFATLLELKVQVRKDLEEEEDRRFRREVQEKAIDRLIDANPFDVPEVMIENYLESLLEEDRRRRPSVPDESKREEEVKTSFRDAAMRTIRRYFILDAVRKQENVELTREDVDARVAKLVESTGRSEKDILATLRNPDVRRTFEGELLDEKVLSLLRDKVSIKAA